MMKGKFLSHNFRNAVLCSVLIGACFLLQSAPAAHAAISLVQATTSVPAAPLTGATTASISSASSVTAGDLIVVGMYNDSSVDISTIVDNLGDSYIHATTTDNPTFARNEVWYTTAKSSGAWNATATYAVTATQRIFNFAEYSGLASATMDVYSGNKGNSPGITSGTSTITSAPELIVGLDATAQTSTIGAGFTLVTGNGPTNGSDYTTFEATTTLTSGVAWSTPQTQANCGCNWVDTMVAFKGFVPGTPGTPTYASISTSTLTVNWATSTNATTYDLERSTDGTSFSHIASTTDPTATYGDSGLALSTTYYYRVRAQNSSGSGSYSASSSATTVSSCGAGCLAQYTFPTSTFSATTVASGVTAGDVANPQGLLIFAVDGTLGYSSSPVLRVEPLGTAISTSTAVSNGSYYTFSITPAAGNQVNLSTLTFNAARGGVGTPRGWLLRSSVDSYAANVSSSDIGTVRPTWSGFSIDLSGSQFQGLTSTTTFRMYVYAPNTATVEFDDLTVNGTVTASGGAPKRSRFMGFGISR